MGIGDWGLEIRDWELGIGRNDKDNISQTQNTHTLYTNKNHLKLYSLFLII